MVKRIFLTLLMLLILVYLALAVSVLNDKPKAMVCSGLKLDIKDSVYAGFIKEKEVTLLLKKHSLDPTDKRIDEINTQLIEDQLATHPLIDAVECYTTPSGLLRIEVSQRIPLLRVMDSSGGNFFVDTKGRKMASSAHCVARLPIATGFISQQMACGELYQFAGFLMNDDFWNAQIEQIHVLKGGDVELVPRVGNHLIYMGKLKGYERKLARLKEFYRKGLNKVGWNKYSRISVEFSNQIICTRRE